MARTTCDCTIAPNVRTVIASNHLNCCPIKFTFVYIYSIERAWVRSVDPQLFDGKYGMGDPAEHGFVRVTVNSHISFLFSVN